MMVFEVTVQMPGGENAEFCVIGMGVTREKRLEAAVNTALEVVPEAVRLISVFEA